MISKIGGIPVLLNIILFTNYTEVQIKCLRIFAFCNQNDNEV